jgi:hypothetical protein
MKRLAIVTCAVALGVFATVSAANAAAPELSKKTCEAQGGTFSSDKGTKTCTTVLAPYTQDGPQLVNSVAWGPIITYTAYYHYVLTLQSTTTQSAKGSGDVTTTNTLQTLSQQLVKDGCQQVENQDGAIVTYTVPTTECDAQGAYPMN